MYIDERRLYLLCARRQITIKELFAKAGVSYQTLVTIKKGWRSTTKTIGKISAALQCDPTEILREEA